MEVHGLPNERPPIPNRRIWLDAAQEDDTNPPPPIPAVPVPAIPPEHASAFHTPNPKRKSAPGRVRTRVDNAAASPQVISSLLDSFTTVGLPDYSQNRPRDRSSGPNPSPATPVLRQRASFGPGSERTSLTDYEIYRQQLADELEEPQAAEPPVIRTSKRPSGKSEWTAPKVSHESTLGCRVRSFGRSTSSLSLHRGGDEDERRSLGGASIDSTARRRSLVSLSRESLDFRLSKKKSQGRIKSPMKENFGNDAWGETESVRETVLHAISATDHLKPTTPTSPGRRRQPFDSVIQEEEISPTFEQVEMEKDKGKKSVHVDSVMGPNVPNRRSSLRHSQISDVSRDRHSRDISNLQIEDALTEEAAVATKEADTTKDTKEEDTKEEDTKEKDTKEEPQSKVMLNWEEGAPTSVTQRIRDLRAKKEQRDRENRASLSPEAPAISNASRSRSTSPLAKSTPVFESKEDRAANKKSRIAQLGTISVPPRGAASKKGTSPRALNAPAPQQPTTPVTPVALPMNYSYVVQSLSTKESAPSLNGGASQTSHTTSNDSDATAATVKKRRPLSIGGRSAVARAQASKDLPDLPDGNSASTTRVHTSPELMETQSRSSTEPEKSHSRSNSLRLKTRRRWSLPEVPPTVDRANSMKRHESLAVQPHRPSKIVEEEKERPSSADSIDLDVKKFTSHPRLSQKIRHPQSGRTIAFSEVGDPDGHVVFCCVGMGLTRYVTAFYDELAATLGLRLITPDRPGVGGSDSAGPSGGLPLNWPDDILAICQALRISKFSILAHSAGAIYALATALRMPQHIRGRVHLLAPWIPPSQMAPIGLTTKDPPPAAQLPKSQRFLRAMPTPFLKIANTGLLSAASASLKPDAAGSPRRERRRRSDKYASTPTSEKRSNGIDRSDSKTSDMNSASTTPPVRPSHARRESMMLMDQQDMPSTRDLRTAYSSHAPSNLSPIDGTPTLTKEQLLVLEEEVERKLIYQDRLTLAIWSLATQHANPAVDLLICLERNRSIGFMYKDITRSVVIHHGSKDSRVPVENVKWIGGQMRKCEVRIMEGEGHGLMANGVVMGNVLEEVGREWREWETMVRKTNGTGSRR